eukprot:755863-Hanusia_phi.AAC.3
MIDQYMKEGRIIPDNLRGWNEIVAGDVNVQFMLFLECSEEGAAGNNASGASVRAREEASVRQEANGSQHDEQCRRIRADEGTIATVYEEVRKSIVPLLEQKVEQSCYSRAYLTVAEAPWSGREAILRGRSLEGDRDMVPRFLTCRQNFFLTRLVVSLLTRVGNKSA